MPRYPDSQSTTSTNIPPGGRKDQILTKASDSNYNVKWSSPSGTGSGGSGRCDCEPMSIIDIIKIMGEN